MAARWIHLCRPTAHQLLRAKKNQARGLGVQLESRCGRFRPTLRRPRTAGAPPRRGDRHPRPGPASFGCDYWPHANWNDSAEASRSCGSAPQFMPTMPMHASDRSNGAGVWVRPEQRHPFDVSKHETPRSSRTDSQCRLHRTAGTVPPVPRSPNAWRGLHPAACAGHLEAPCGQPPGMNHPDSTSPAAEPTEAELPTLDDDALEATCGGAEQDGGISSYDDWNVTGGA